MQEKSNEMTKALS